MTQSLDTNALRDAYAAFQDVYGDASGREWRQNFASQVATVQQASAELWATPDFQEILWRAGGISSIGAGAAVSVTGIHRKATTGPDRPAARRALSPAYDLSDG